MGHTLLPHTLPDKEAQAGTVSQLVVLLALLGRTVAKHTPTYVLMLRSDWPTNQSANPRQILALQQEPGMKCSLKSSKIDASNNHSFF